MSDGSTTRAKVENLSASDAVLWRIDRDPVLRTTIVALMLLDRPPAWDVLSRRLQSVTRLVPKLRSRVEQPSGWAAPRWVEVSDFDLRFHLRRVSAASPGTLRSLLDMVDPIAMSDVDRMRPPWELTIVEGLENGRAAAVLKTHHVLTDGVGGIQVVLRLLDQSRRPRREASTPDGLAVPAQKPASRIGGRGGVLGTAKALTALIGGPNPLDAVRRLLGSAGAVGRLLAPAGKPMSLLMRDRSLSRHVETLDMPLSRLAGAASRLGVSINDVFLSSVLGGLRLYHERHGAAVEGLRVNMPVSLRSEQDPVGGNRFTPVRFVAPAGISDPLERTERLSALTRGWKTERGLALSDSLATLLNRLPPDATTAAFGAMLKGVDVVVTDIPGPSFNTYLAGARVMGFFAFAPPSGAAASISLCTEADRACVGMNLDVAAIPDGELLASCMAEGFDEVVNAARARPAARPRSLARVGGA